LLVRTRLRERYLIFDPFGCAQDKFAIADLQS